MARRDTNPSPLEADATGIMQCLQMLADEAADLQLSRTLAALRAAMEVCASENHRASVKVGFDEDPFMDVDGSIVLH